MFNTIKSLFGLSTKLFDSNYKITYVSVGEGNFKIGQHKRNHTKYAIKTINRKLYDESDYGYGVQKEVNLLKTINHPQIVQLKDFYKENVNVYLVMELMSGGDLFDSIINKGYFGEHEAASIITQIASILQYLHSKHIVHRDIKPENLLFVSREANSLLKLTDFSLATTIAPDDKLYESCGTPGYLAPECIYASTRGYNMEVDIWATGMLMCIYIYHTIIYIFYYRYYSVYIIMWFPSIF